MSTVEVHKQISADEIATTFEEEAPITADLGQYAVEDWLAGCGTYASRPVLDPFRSS